MRVLIVEADADLAQIWGRHLERRGAAVRIVGSQEEAIAVIQEDEAVDVIVLDLVLEPGSAFAVADFASYRVPEAKVIFVTRTTFFSDGSIFRHIPNAYAFIGAETPVDDLAAMVEHYGLRH